MHTVPQALIKLSALLAPDVAATVSCLPPSLKLSSSLLCGSQQLWHSKKKYVWTTAYFAAATVTNHVYACITTPSL